MPNSNFPQDVTLANDETTTNQPPLMVIGQMTAQLAHQIRTPLSSAILYTEHLKTHPSMDERCLHWIHHLEACHANIAQQLHELLLFARGKNLEPSLSDVDAWATTLLSRAKPFIDPSKVNLTINHCLEKRMFQFHAESMVGALMNLIINALEAEATVITLTLQSMNKGGLQLRIEDNGIGMTGDIKCRAFDPFFTSKPKGTGLGLAVVYQVVKAHNGEISLNSLPGKGSCVTINLPG